MKIKALTELDILRCGYFKQLHTCVGYTSWKSFLLFLLNFL